MSTGAARTPGLRRSRASQRLRVQYLSIRDTERLAAAGIEPSVGSVGDSYDGENDVVVGRPGLTPRTNDLVSWR
jgi:hypothetical protein